jgi:multidrug efflux pump subunit AcrB
LLRFRWLVIVIALGVFSGSLFIQKSLRHEFSPQQDQSALIIRAKAPEGSSLGYTDERMKEVEAIVAMQPEIARYFSNVGGFGGEVNSGMIFVTLKQPADRSIRAGKTEKLTQQDFSEILRAELKNIKGIKTFVSEPTMGSIGGGQGNPIEFSIRGPDWSTLIAGSKAMVEEMAKMSELRDVENGYKGIALEFHVLPDRKKALLHGVNVSDIANTVNILMGGLSVAKFSSADRRYDIKIRQAPEERISEQDILKMRVRNNRGELIALSQLVKIESAESMQSITRKDRERAISVVANLSKGANQEAAIQAVAAMAKKVLPPGYRAIPSGSSQTFKDTFKSLVFALMLGLVVSYMVLASQFNSFVDPITVLIALPFSITGAFMALYAANQSINIYSMIGIILLMGLVKKNSILLVDFTNQVRLTSKANISAALIEACPVRLRPILMTSVATIAAAIPPALAVGPGAETRIPLAVTIIGGVSLSTILTLFVVPCVYSLLTRRGELSEAIED